MAIDMLVLYDLSCPGTGVVDVYDRTQSHLCLYAHICAHLNVSLGVYEYMCIFATTLGMCEFYVSTVYEC